MTIDHVVAAPRCALFARSEELDPRGTAGSYDGFLLVEHPIPWERDVGQIPGLQELGPVVDASPRRYRIQALVPRPRLGPGGDDGAVTVVHYRRPAGDSFVRFARSEHRVPREQLVERVTELVADDPALADPTGTGAAAELLVCTHGKRDLCCGSAGTRLFTHLPDFGAPVRAWRTSHTGGHRFAPTAALFPEGTLWAYLDERTIAGVVDRTLPAAEAATLYRGCTGLDGSEVQALDAAVLAEAGWAWLDEPRAGTVVGREGDSCRVRIDGRSGLRWEATVVVVRRVPILDCGRPVEAAKSLQPELRVDDFSCRSRP